LDKKKLRIVIQAIKHTRRRTEKITKIRKQKKVQIRTIRRTRIRITQIRTTKEITIRIVTEEAAIKQEST
jgi:hypothetical protein